LKGGRMPNRIRIFRWTIALLAIALAAAPVLAQYGQSTGGIQGRVTDEQGGVLPGVQVTLRGPGAPQTATVIRILESEFKNQDFIGVAPRMPIPVID
jgi:hypothetical protein